MWQPIETAPKDERNILAIRFGEECNPSYRVVYWDTEAEAPHMWHVEDAADGFNVHQDFFTHWMPLPEPPSA